MSKIVIGYWDLRGKGEAARMMLRYHGTDFEDRRYPITGEAPNFDRSSWLDVKFKLGFDFPNLPYLIDGDVKMTESWAIYRYLGRKLGLEPITESEIYVCDMLQGILETLRSNIIPICYTTKNIDDIKSKVPETQPLKLHQLDQFLDGRQFLAGDRITYVDFPFYETLDYHRLLIPGMLDEYRNLQAFLKRFESLEPIASWLKSDGYKRFPITGPYAYWGGQRE